MFIEWAIDRSNPGRLPFERLCAAHPRLANELRRLKQQDERLAQVAELSGMAGGGLASGVEADEETSIAHVTEKTSPSGSAARRLIDDLRTREESIGRYFLRREVGAGSMGKVYLAHDRDLHRNVALKIIRRSAPENDAWSDADNSSTRAFVRFVEEAQVSAQLDHPSIVPIHDFGVTRSGYAYFAMKHVKGITYSEVIQRVHSQDRSWTLKRAVGILLRACEALAYAHHKGVVHRDLKPANIMIGRFGETFVMDWGLAQVGSLERQSGHTEELDEATGSVILRPYSSRTASGELDPLRTQVGGAVGTPCYMPAEQANYQPGEVGPVSDVYSIGAILYHLIAGTPPFQPKGSDPLGAQAVYFKIISGERPPALEDQARHAPSELVAIVNKAMAASTTSRYEGIDELRNDLAAYLEGRVVRAAGQRRGMLRAPLKWMRRHPIAVSVAAVAAIGFGWRSISRSATAPTAAVPASIATSLVNGLESDDPTIKERTRAVLHELSVSSADSSAVQDSHHELLESLRGLEQSSPR
ncbi:MAG: serine/threonine-protein kinase [Planctomycetota bacterium]